MKIFITNLTLSAKCFICISVSILFFNPAFAQKFNVSYISPTQSLFSGNVFLYLSKDNRNPKDGSIGFESLQCFRITVKNIKPNQPVLFDDSAVSYPVSLTDIEKGEYFVQAVWDNNLGGRAINNSPGNIYNKTARVRINKGRNDLFNIVCKEVVPDKLFEETEYNKQLKVNSKLLSDFYGRSTTIDAAVLLPKEYTEQPKRRFPVSNRISGYGDDYHKYSGAKDASAPLDTIPCIRIFLDGNCPLGHCVYANSENNGPWGDAFVKEFIPEVDRTYRSNGGRLLFGHSSGGWSVLWLQTQYPKAFTACWSSSPDPVDFRSFQKINLYLDKSMFFDKDSTLRLTATIAGVIPWATMKQAYRMENVISRGEQMRSFDAVFSQRKDDGKPRELCNYYTGVIDSSTVEHWKNYDICLYLRTEWNTLKPDIQGKIRISVGEQDNYLLNYAVHMLDQEMKKLDTGFEFAYYPGDHAIVTTSSEYRSDGGKFLERKYNEYINHKTDK